MAMDRGAWICFLDSKKTRSQLEMSAQVGKEVQWASSCTHWKGKKKKKVVLRERSGECRGQWNSYWLHPSWEIWRCCQEPRSARKGTGNCTAEGWWLLSHKQDVALWMEPYWINTNTPFMLKAMPSCHNDTMINNGATYCQIAWPTGRSARPTSGTHGLLVEHVAYWEGNTWQDGMVRGTCLSTCLNIYLYLTQCCVVKYSVAL